MPPNVKVSKIVDNLSYVPIQILACFNEAELAIGTAFLYRWEEKVFLVTNWHNVSGRKPITHKAISPTCAIPNALVCRIPFEVQKPTDSTPGAIQWQAQKFPLYNSNDVPEWWEHPELKDKVDVAVIEMTATEKTVLKPANDPSLKLDNLRLRPGMDVFVLGYPRGFSGGARFPIWKRGSIANEPDIDLDGLPKLYIDTATREGMSGSPVYAQESGYWAPEGYDLGTAESTLGRGNRFLGIYSGRVGDDTFQAQMGIVWKESAIQAIIAGKTPGQNSFSL